DHHHGILIVVIRLEARHADHSSSVFSILPKLSRQRGFSTGSTNNHNHGITVLKPTTTNL
ncbi:hypothetical protein, partial [Vreelandella olivaria]|uniref:hypothetical protein n=1 Tax=Vreelandella olivaria TaxID=390919 RepID=UPI00201EED06